MSLSHREGANSELHSFFTLGVDAGEWSVSRRIQFIQVKTFRYALKR